jgi:hypothetical protein
LESGAIRITYRLLDIFGGRGQGLTVRACREIDSNCDSPFPDVPPQTSNASGEATLVIPRSDFPTSFQGFAEISGKDYVTALVSLPPLTRDFIAFVGVVKTSDFSTLTGGLELDPERANVIVRIFDCTGGSAGGVTLALDGPDAGAPFYFVRGFPSPTASATEDDPHLGSVAAFLNVESPTSLITVGAKVSANGLAYPEAHAVTRKGANTFTEILMYPSSP